MTKKASFYLETRLNFRRGLSRGLWAAAPNDSFELGNLITPNTWSKLKHTSPYTVLKKLNSDKDYVYPVGTTHISTG